VGVLHGVEDQGGAVPVSGGEGVLLAVEDLAEDRSVTPAARQTSLMRVLA
jgi:hypothetical protein